MDNDKRLMARAKTLNTQLQGERTRLQGVGSAGDDRTGADLLREDAEAAESEAALCRDREQILQLEVCVNEPSTRSLLSLRARPCPAIRRAVLVCFFLRSPAVTLSGVEWGPAMGLRACAYHVPATAAQPWAHRPLCCGREGGPCMWMGAGGDGRA